MEKEKWGVTLQQVCNFSYEVPWCLSGEESSESILEMQVHSLGWEDPLEKEMASQCSILAWEIPWIDEPIVL